MLFLLAVYSLLTLEQPHVKEFLVEASKSGPVKYSFVKPKDCISGKLKDSYVLANNGKVFLKQVSEDGSIGPVCVR